MTETTAQRADVSTDAMRAEADQLKAGVREDHRALWERSRRAVQLAYEADLIDTAALALAELDGARQRTPRLQAAAGEAITAERAAEDRLRKDEQRLRRRQADQQKARAEHADGEHQEELAVRVRALADVARTSQAALDAARRKRQDAEAELASWEAHVAELDREHAEAARKAEHPGPAPDLPGLVPGVARVGDMDDEQRQLVGLIAILARQGQLSTPDPGAGSGAQGGRGALAGQDRDQFRHVIHRSQHVVIPPDWRGGAS